ncbi:uncharacterized protein LOC121733692 [Aricia agestis]|uniref:uncharacterized protein LOC121733692 n=1 Tax=Aricia agestis TaxID=91739 RepID=UPI001C203B2A|nr:uncharacterized protein LOC121733692 [Aricia agestis]
MITTYLYVFVAVFVCFDTVHTRDVFDLPPLPRPECCIGTYDITDRQCCIFPPFFNRETARECGAKIFLSFTDRTVNITGSQRNFINGCDYWECVLDKYGLLDTENNLSMEKYFDHLDVWISLNTMFRTVIIAGRTHCKQIYQITKQLPIKTCKFFEFQGCIRNYVNVDCPDIIQTAACIEWKKFYDECRDYFI